MDIIHTCGHLHHYERQLQSAELYGTLSYKKVERREWGVEFQEITLEYIH
jgi:hypothetical protein